MLLFVRCASLSSKWVNNFNVIEYVGGGTIILKSLKIFYAMGNTCTYPYTLDGRDEEMGSESPGSRVDVNESITDRNGF